MGIWASQRVIIEWEGSWSSWLNMNRLPFDRTVTNSLHESERLVSLQWRWGSSGESLVSSTRRKKNTHFWLEVDKKKMYYHIIVELCVAMVRGKTSQISAAIFKTWYHVWSTQLAFFFKKNQKSTVVKAKAKLSAAPNTPCQGCDFATFRLSRRKVSGQDREKSARADKSKRTGRKVEKPKLFLPQSSWEAWYASLLTHLQCIHMLSHQQHL